MGWMIIGFVIAIIAIAVLCYFIDYEGIAITVLIVSIIASVIVLWNVIDIFDARVGVYENYQYQYEQYVLICDEIEDCGSSDIFENEELMRKIRKYNAEIYRAKNETFMNKYTHNQRFKDLEYIEVEGLVINPNEDTNCR